MLVLQKPSTLQPVQNVLWGAIVYLYMLRQMSNFCQCAAYATWWRNRMNEKKKGKLEKVNNGKINGVIKHQTKGHGGPEKLARRGVRNREAPLWAKHTPWMEHDAKASERDCIFIQPGSDMSKNSHKLPKWAHSACPLNVESQGCSSIVINRKFCPSAWPLPQEKGENPSVLWVFFSFKTDIFLYVTISKMDHMHDTCFEYVLNKVSSKSYYHLLRRFPKNLS